MQPERIAKVNLIVAAALERTPDSRRSFINDACIGEPDLLRQVEESLAHADKTQEFHDVPPTLEVSARSSAELSAQETLEIQRDNLVGKEFGKYKIKHRIAEGGMGIVYLALDTQLGRQVALKILPPYFSMDKERVARFRREARATSLLNHPNIVTVFEVGQADECEFIVTEFVEGRTLREFMQQAPLALIEAVKIATQVAGALSAAHKAGIVHRDIKPENIMLRPDGYVKVLDFGLAKLTDTTRKTGSGELTFGASGQTIPGVIMGTVAYMSPEQAGAQEIDARTDIWALGVLVYEMAAGKVPFSGPSPSHTIVAILEQEPEAISGIMPELSAIIFRALQKDRSLRFQTADEMLAALEDLKNRLGYISDKSIERATDSQPTVEAVTATKPSRKAIWAVPAAALLLLFAVGGIYAIVSWMNGFRPQADSPTLPAANSTGPVSEQVLESNINAANAPIAANSAPVTELKQANTASTSDNSPEANTRTSAAKRQLTSEPVRTPRPEARKKPPVRQTKARQDPNCVFTNTCG